MNTDSKPESRGDSRMLWLLLGLTGVTLGLVTYVAVSLPLGAGTPNPLPSVGAAPEGWRGAATDLAAVEAIQELRAEVKRLRENLEQRVGAVESALVAGGATNHAAAPPSTLAAAIREEPEAAQALAEMLAEGVAEEFEQKLASARRERNAAGQWKAPMDQLARELDMTEDQRWRSEEVFDGARDEVFELFKTPRPDGGSLLDDLVVNLKSGHGEPFTEFTNRLSSEMVPGTNRTYLAELIALGEIVNQNLSEHLSEEQLRTMKSLAIAPLEIQTGYDPVGDFISKSML